VTEIAVRNGYAPAELVPVAETPSALMQWVREAQQAQLVAESLARTSFVPASLRGRPDDITAAILAGQELDLPPMATLRSMDIINGTPALRAHAMRGLVQSKGHKVWVEPGASKERVVVCGQRRDPDGSYGEVQESVWDVERATVMGLINKPEWKKQPQTMLTARATGEICRLIASDVLYAMPYAAEELDGEPGPEQTTRVTAAEVLGRRRPEPAAVAPPTDGSDMPASAEQLRELGIAFAEAGVTVHTGKGATALNDQARFAWLAENVGAEVTSTKELTYAQCALAAHLLRQAQAERVQARAEVEAEVVRLFDGLNVRLSGVDRLRDAGLLIGRPVQSVRDITDDELAVIVEVLTVCEGNAAAWDAAVTAAQTEHTPSAAGPLAPEPNPEEQQ
jgi:hypothetical protein